MSRESCKSGPNLLGDYLANVRESKGFTLREVEEATDKQVSNGYLSQLEHGRISRPSPNVLYSLASVYGTSYETLMQKAGYISATEKFRKPQSDTHAHAIENLTEEEHKALKAYLSFLRSQQTES